MTVFFCRLHLSLKTCLSRGHVTKFPFPSSSLKSSDTLKRNMFSSLDSDGIQADTHFGTLRNAVAKLYRILPTCQQTCLCYVAYVLMFSRPSVILINILPPDHISGQILKLMWWKKLSFASTFPVRNCHGMVICICLRFMHVLPYGINRV